MRKIIKGILYVVICVLVGVIGISLYVGNYLYDYTINPHSEYSIFERLDIDEEKSESAYTWLNENARSITSQSEDGLNLHSYYINQGSDVTVLLVHGYRSEGASVINPIKRFYKEGYNMLIPDLRGHGKSEGDYIGMGEGDRKDIMMWINYLVEKNHNAIVLYGISMGGATVLNVSAEELPLQVKAIISDCAYSSIIELLRYHLDLDDIKNKTALTLASFITYIRAGYRIEDVAPIDKVKHSQVPILFIHGEKDDFVPCYMVYDLYDAASCPKDILVLSEAKHANSFKYSNIYYKHVLEFIHRYIKSNRNVDEFTKIYH